MVFLRSDLTGLVTFDRLSLRFLNVKEVKCDFSSSFCRCFTDNRKKSVDYVSW